MSLFDELKNAQPEWRKDGMGLRGHQVPLPDRLSQQKAEWPVSAVTGEILQKQYSKVEQQSSSSPSDSPQVKKHPFMVLGSPSSSSSFLIYPYSFLYSNSFSQVDIGNLTSSFSAPSVGQKIWLSIDVTSRTVITPSGASINAGANWTGYPNPIVLDVSDPANPYQIKYNQIIAECVSVNDQRDGIIINNVKIIQRLNSNLICTQWAVNGVPCVVPEHFDL